MSEPGAPRWTIELCYPSGGALRTDVETQLALGGLYLETQAPEGFPSDGALKLRITAPGLPGFELDAVLAERTASSLCVEVNEDTLGPLRAALAAVAPEAAEIPLLSFHEAEAAAAPRGGQSAELSLDRRIAVMSIGEKVQLALHGPREARMLLARDRAGSIQVALIRNPRVSVDEVTSLARAAVLAPDAADALAQHRTFGSSQQVLAALARNPRTPIPIAVELVARLHPTELRTLAKGSNVRAPVAAAARKKLNAD